MKLGGRGRTRGRTGECELNAQRIRMNDDKTCSLCFYILVAGFRQTEGKRSPMFALTCAHVCTNIVLLPSDGLTFGNLLMVLLRAHLSFCQAASVNALYLFYSNLVLSDSW